MFIKNIVDKIKGNENNIYYSKFLHLIFRHLLPNVIFDDDFVVLVCQMHKKQFSVMVNNDKKKSVVFGAMIYPD